MKVRLAVYGGLLAIVFGGLIVYRIDDARGQAETETILRLWSAEAEDLMLRAGVAGGLYNDQNVSSKGGAFLPWDRWPEKLRTSGIMRYLVPRGTRRADGLVVTVFTKTEDSEVLVFYVLPDVVEEECLWYAVVAMDSDSLVYARYPDETDPVVEKREGDCEPIEVIKRICSQRK